MIKTKAKQIEELKKEITGLKIDLNRKEREVEYLHNENIRLTHEAELHTSIDFSKIQEILNKCKYLSFSITEIKEKLYNLILQATIHNKITIGEAKYVLNAFNYYELR